MLNPSDVLQTLTRLGADAMSGVVLRPEADDAAIRRMQAAAERDLGDVVPDGYVELLRTTNGVQINGAFFKEAENLVLENLDLPHREIIVLGNSGNVDQYVFDRRDHRFHTINMGYPAERWESFDTFEAMLRYVMRQQQVL